MKFLIGKQILHCMGHWQSELAELRDAQLFFHLPCLCTAGLGQSKYTSWCRMSPQCRYCAWMSAAVREFHASLIRCLMLTLVSGGPSSTRRLQWLNRELSRGDRRLAD